MASRAEVIVALKRTKTMGVSKKVRFEVFKRDKFTCQYCGKRPPDVVLECDHIVPRAKGGQDEIQNLTTACFDCNRGKRDIPLGDVAPHLDEMAVLESIQEMAERRVALKAEVEEAQAQRTAEDDATGILMDQWQRDVSDGGFDEHGIRIFLDKMEFRDICRAIDIVAAWRSEHYWKTEYACWKYLCGVCWTLIRQKKEDDGE